jgi:hypothetical protein
MSSILLFSLRPDDQSVRNIVGALVESDLDVSWESRDGAEERLRRPIDHEGDKRAAVFFWSRGAESAESAPYRALASNWVRARSAIFVRLDDANPSRHFPDAATYDLRGWRARASSLFMLDLVAAVKAKSAGLDPPLPRAPGRLLARRLMLAAPGLIGAVALAVGLYRDLGVDRIASRSEAAAWKTASAGSCDDLRGFLQSFSEGVHAAEAQARLAGARKHTVASSVTVDRPLPLYLSLALGDASATSDAAKRDVARRATAEAEARCLALAQATSSRLLAVSVLAGAQTCEVDDVGHRCMFDGHATCRLAEPTAITVERCAD